MLLLIEEAKKDREVIKTEIEELHTRLEGVQCEEIEAALTKLNSDLMKFKDQLKHEKIRKFKRDDKDYKENKVYFWHKQRNTPSQEPLKRGARTVSFNFTSEEEDQDGHMAVYNPNEDHLGNGKAPRYGGTRKQQRGRKKELEGDVRNRTEHDYPTRNRKSTR